MTFLNPLVLFGLAAAAIPILIHLLNLRKLKTVEFSTLRFLHELQRTRMRRLRLRQWILLLLRTLLVVFLVLAFSRPAVRTSLAGLGTEAARSTMVIVLDDSPSMSLRNQNGILFDQAREIVTRIASLARPGDDIHLLRLSQSEETGTQEPSQSVETLGRALPEMRPSQRSYRYDRIMDRARALAVSSPNVHREIYVLTDGQASHLVRTGGAGDSVATQTDGRIRLFWIPLAPGNTDNLAVTSATVESQVLARDRPFTVQATIQNFGAVPRSNSVASLYLDGVRVAQRSVSLSPRGSGVVSFAAVPKRRGAIGGYIQCDEDGMEIDNRRYFTLTIPENIGVLLAGSAQTDTRYPALALTLEGDSSVAGLFTVRQTTKDRLALAELAPEVFVLANTGGLSAGLSARIVREIRDGKGLIVFPGPDADIDAVNRSLFTPLGIPPLVSPPQGPGPDRGPGFLRFDRVDQSHPVFSGMFDQRRAQRGTPSVESPRIQRAVMLSPGQRGNPIITLTDGRPFLCEYPAGRGKVFLFAVDAAGVWSDFPFKGIFAPLLYRSVLYLSTEARPTIEYTVGDRLTFVLRHVSADGGAPLAIISPSGVRELVQSRSSGAGATDLAESSPTEESGIYRLQVTGPSAGSRGTIQAIAVNQATLESDLTSATVDRQQDFWRRHGIPEDEVTVVASPAAVPRSIEETRYGVELWRVFLLLAIACALAEMAVARVTGSPAPENQDYA